jgi:hypothetical protein
MSMDSNGKIIFAKHSEVSQANLKNLTGVLRGYSKANLRMNFSSILL